MSAYAIAAIVVVIVLMFLVGVMIGEYDSGFLARRHHAKKEEKE